MIGRKPKPTALKLLAGNPGHRPLNADEPKPSGTPTCPEHLNETANSEWNRISGELSALGLLTLVDRAALAAYCMVYARWVDAELNIQKYGTVIKTKAGNAIQNPYVGVANRALDLMYKFQSEFGMTPSSRSRLSVTPSSQAPAGSWDEFIDQVPEEPSFDPTQAN
jgi:P27 family predicted phage terminase small subunit